MLTICRVFETWDKIQVEINKVLFIIFLNDYNQIKISRANQIQTSRSLREY